MNEFGNLYVFSARQFYYMNSLFKVWKNGILPEIRLKSPVDMANTSDGGWWNSADPINLLFMVPFMVGIWYQDNKWYEKCDTFIL